MRDKQGLSYITRCITRRVSLLKAGTDFPRIRCENRTLLAAKFLKRYLLVGTAADGSRTHRTLLRVWADDCDALSVTVCEPLISELLFSGELNMRAKAPLALGVLLPRCAL